MTHSHENRHGWRWWLDRWWVAVPLTFLLMTGIRLLTDRDGGLFDAAMGALIYTALLTPTAIWRRRKDARALGADPDRVPDLDRRIQKEDVPEDPEERREMAVLVRRREEQLRPTGRWGLPVTGVGAVLLIVLFLLLGEVVAAAVVVVVAALLVLVALWNRRLFARYARLTERLGATSGTRHDDMRHRA
ncbi:hypothetical protein OG875_08125 [Streptomyces sp. NBC_01498]|uniref:hypothetical protein n=1 Tax=Streptomyces sp. NBC_01498 TaxID=2975870 RepID=UPI002E7C0694|nr:hypothetical protein [Streptomyces sp. NBC_01498]WTL24569.1 hypothetical protein OG875_08125 [Streptomyces sp. NBC_01498]